MQLERCMSRRAMLVGALAGISGIDSSATYSDDPIKPNLERKLSWLISKQFILGLAYLSDAFSCIIVFVLWAPFEIPLHILHLSTYYYHGYRFWGTYRFRVFCVIIAFGGGPFTFYSVSCTSIQGLSQLQVAARNRHSHGTLSMQLLNGMIANDHQFISVLCL